MCAYGHHTHIDEHPSLMISSSTDTELHSLIGYNRMPTETTARSTKKPWAWMDLMCDTAVAWNKEGFIFH